MNMQTDTRARGGRRRLSRRQDPGRQVAPEPTLGRGALSGAGQDRCGQMFGVSVVITTETPNISKSLREEVRLVVQGDGCGSGVEDVGVGWRPSGRACAGSGNAAEKNTNRAAF